MIKNGEWYSYEIGKIGLDGNMETDYSQIQKAIVQSIISANEEMAMRKELKEKQIQEELRVKRSEILKEKDFSYIKCQKWREFRTFFNSLRMLWNLLTLTREEAKYFSALSGLTRMLTSLLLFVIGIAFYVLAGIFVASAFFAGMFAAECIIVAILFLVFARLVRIARFEIEHIEDDSFLMNIAMMVIALVTLVVTIIGIIISAYASGE